MNIIMAITQTAAYRFVAQGAIEIEHRYLA